MDAKRFREILEDADYEPSSYSGRGMYGKRCVSIQVGYPADLIMVGVTLASALINQWRDNDLLRKDLSTLSDILTNTSIDQLGRGYVVYWPSSSMEEEDD